MPGEIRAALDRVWAADLPMPADDASEEDWDTWSDLQLLLSVLAGWPDKHPERWLEEFHGALALPGVSTLVGGNLEDVRRLGRWIAETTPAPRAVAGRKPGPRS